MGRLAVELPGAALERAAGSELLGACPANT
jgi:hypothetical protein